MPYFQMDDGTDSEAAVFQAGTAAFGLYSRCGVWVSRNLTDGFVPAELAASYGTREWIERLLATGLWESVDGGYRMPAYLGKHGNKSAEKVLELRAAAAERTARFRQREHQKRRESRVTGSVTNGVSHGGSHTSQSNPPLKGDGVGAPASRSGAPPTPNTHPSAPAPTEPRCDLHFQPHPCRGCAADAKAGRSDGDLALDASLARHPIHRRPATAPTAESDPP
jgi:hypothetical protein